MGGEREKQGRENSRQPHKVTLNHSPKFSLVNCSHMSSSVVSKGRKEDRPCHFTDFEEIGGATITHFDPVPECSSSAPRDRTPWGMLGTRQGKVGREGAAPGPKFARRVWASPGVAAAPGAEGRGRRGAGGRARGRCLREHAQGRGLGLPMRPRCGPSEAGGGGGTGRIAAFAVAAAGAAAASEAGEEGAEERRADRAPRPGPGGGGSRRRAGNFPGR